MEDRGGFADIRGTLGATVGILVDYESPLARKVAGDVWSGLSRAALEGGHTRTTAVWESLREPGDAAKLVGPQVRIFAVGQDHPDAIDAVEVVGRPGAHHLYGLIVAVPERPSPLVGSLLYQGVRRLVAGGAKAGSVEPALLHATPEECDSYARRLLGRVRAW